MQGLRHSQRFRVNKSSYVIQSQFGRNLLCRVCQAGNDVASSAMADGEVGLNDDHVIIRTSDMLEMRRPQHRADPVGETRRVGEGELDSRNFV